MIHDQRRRINKTRQLAAPRLLPLPSAENFHVRLSIKDDLSFTPNKLSQRFNQKANLHSTVWGGAPRCLSGSFLRLPTDSGGGVMHSGLKYCLLDGGGDAKVPDARGRELAGVQVGDVLHHFVKGVDVVALDGQRGLAGVELHLNGVRRRR